jgi:hypothetical protein
MSGTGRGGWLRVGGHFEVGSARTTWSVAEGRRGRRWRTVTRDGDGGWRSMLLEVDPAGRPGRLELVTPTGLLTAHPEPEQTTLHGNVVTADAVRPIAVPWRDGDVLIVAGEPITLAVAIQLVRRRGRGAAAERVAAVEVDAGLRATDAAWVVRAETPALWWAERVHPAAAGTWIGLDDDGLLSTVDGIAVNQVRWPLEDA